MKQYKTGTKVKLLESSQWTARLYNPKIGSIFECEGVVESVVEELSAITVRWSNGESNSYTPGDLVSVDEPQNNTITILETLDL